MNFAKELNPQQLEAVTHGDGPLLVLAGAGSGKTRVITFRIAWLIHERKVDPARILGVTFTNKAADEMRQRIQKQVGPPAREVTLCTFHSLGLRILRLHSQALGYRRDFTIYNDGDQLALIRTLIREHPQKREKFDAGILLARLSNYKNTLADGPRDYPLFNDKYDLVFGDVFESYQRQLRACQAADFDDLILLPIRLFREHPNILRTCQDQYRYILVDEYQDTNHGQYQFISLLAARHKNLCVVGDDDQSIYGWRGAEIRNILSFTHDYPGAKVVKLEQNYRSTQAILDAAHHVIKNNPKRQDKRLWTRHGRGRNIDAFLAKDENDEAKTIAWRIQTIRERTQAPWLSFAVLYRSNVQSRALESTFRVCRIPYRVVGGYEFFERKEIKDLAAYLRVIQNPRDDLSLLRIVNYPRRGIGDQTIVHLSEQAQKQGISVFAALQRAQRDLSLPKAAREGIHALVEMIGELHQHSQTAPLVNTVRLVLDRSGYRDELQRSIDDPITLQNKIDIVEELVSAASAYAEQNPAGRLRDFIDSISLGDEPERNGHPKKQPSDAVMLVTLHSAKGLEFPYVFLCGMEEDLLPHGRSMKDAMNVDEERRLCYVGMTRAQRHLTLSLTQERNKFGKRVKRVPSRFLREIPPELICKQFSHSPYFFDRQKLPKADSEAGEETQS